MGNTIDMFYRIAHILNFIIHGRVRCCIKKICRLLLNSRVSHALCKTLNFNLFFQTLYDAMEIYPFGIDLCPPRYLVAAGHGVVRREKWSERAMQCDSYLLASAGAKGDEDRRGRKAWINLEHR